MSDVVVTLVVDRKRKYEDELSQMLWKIDFNDVEFNFRENMGSVRRHFSCVDSCCRFLEECLRWVYCGETAPHERVRTCVAYCPTCHTSLLYRSARVCDRWARARARLRACAAAAGSCHSRTSITTKSSAQWRATRARWCPSKW